MMPKLLAEYYSFLIHQVTNPLDVQARIFSAYPKPG